MTTDTAALLRHIAPVLERYAHGDPSVAAVPLCRCLGLHDDASWPDLATALRAHAEALAPGLPEGWEWRDGVHPYARQEYDGTVVQVERGRVWVEDGGDGIEVPVSVVRAVLARAQGVGS